MERVASGPKIKIPRRVRFDATGLRLKISNILTKEEISECVFIFLSEGNNLEKILDGRLSPERHSNLKGIISKAKIQSNCGETGRAVTLKRIATVFPEIVVMTLNTTPNLRGSVPLKKIVALTGVADFPNLGREPYLACLLPKTNPDSQHILNVFMLAHMMLSERINDNFREMSSRNKSVHTESFQLKTFQSSLFNEEKRKQWCERFNITKDNVFTPAWKAAADAAKEKLLEIYESSF